VCVYVCVCVCVCVCVYSHPSDCAKERLEAEVIKSYASEALRVILLSYKDISEAPGEVEDDLVNNLIITAFVGIQVSVG
jgi:magnesium-transporting ATPase (P-type)